MRIFIQCLVTLFAFISAFLISSKGDKKRFIGYIIASFTQPVWMGVVIYDQQWGLLPISIFYVFVNIRGIFNNRKGGTNAEKK